MQEFLLRSGITITCNHTLLDYNNNSGLRLNWKSCENQLIKMRQNICLNLFGVLIFFKKKLAHAYLVRQYFSKSFGGKIMPN